MCILQILFLETKKSPYHIQLHEEEIIKKVKLRYIKVGFKIPNYKNNNK